MCLNLGIKQNSAFKPFRNEVLSIFSPGNGSPIATNVVVHDVVIRFAIC